MKWLLISVALWSDGAYTISPLKAFDAKSECVVPPAMQQQAGEYTVYTSYICVPRDVFLQFAMKSRL